MYLNYSNLKKFISSETFTKNFILRLMLGTIISILLALLFTLVFKTTIHNNHKLQEFKPVNQINRLSNISIDSTKYFFKTNKENSDDIKTTEVKFFKHKLLINKLKNIGCKRRQKALIFENLNTNNLLLKDTKYSYESFLIDTLNKYFSNNTLTCNQFIKDIKTLDGLALLGNDVNKKRAKMFIESYFTEQISWTWKSPCLYFEERKKDLIYMAGPIPNCFFGKEVKSFSESELENEISSLVKIVHQQLHQVKKKEPLTSIKNSKFLITLDPHIQGWLNLYKKCFESLEYCEAISVKSLSKMNNVSIVVLNSDNSEILGAICVGKKCNKSGLNTYRDLAAIHVRSPPASIAKILYGLAFASSDNIEKKLLLRQIKTSGQIDSKLGTRNEWWEKTAICDGEAILDCKHFKNVTKFSEQFGIATSCNKQKEEVHSNYVNATNSNLNCGEISLIKSNGLPNDQLTEFNLSGFLGFTPLLDRVVIDSNGLVTFINWQDYETIRRNKNLVSKEIEFSNTSSIIQSVLGAGDSRVSALGIASLISQISQISKNNNPILPSLVKNKDYKGHNEINSNRTDISKSLIKSASYVITGMKKTLLPKEKEWNGNGTAYNSFRDIFGEDCVNDCPIQGKTGTVSFSDKNFMGTTLFTGLVNSKKMQKYLKNERNKNIPNLAIGVIVFTEKDNSDGHYASQLFMSIVKDIVSNTNLSEIISKKNLAMEKKYLFKYGNE